MDETVWARDPIEGFVLGRINEITADGAEVVPLDPKYAKRILPFSDIFRANVEKNKDYDDNCEMMFLNEGSLLNNIRTRYYKNKIYSYVAHILIAVNPYKEIPELYSSHTIKTYKGKSLGELQPHVFAIADKAFRDMRVFKQSQSIIVSGESGAGKTESTKHLLKYLCEGGSAGPIEHKILDANPILEAFGNAKTTRNNNSSRFGKFIEVHFDNKFQVAGGYISHYLLEKSRICSPLGEERSYHIFYMLMAGGPESLRQKLGLGKPDEFNYLKHGCTRYFAKPSTEKGFSPEQKSAAQIKQGALRDILIDDVDDFKNLDLALSRLGMSESERFQVYSTVAAVLHLGNIEFEENPEDTRGGCRVAKGGEKPLMTASKLLEIDPEELRQALVSRVMQSARGGLKGTVIMVPLKLYEANNARDALAKAVYSNLFDYIVSRINQSIPFQTSSYYIGVLDIAGFEFFTVNSFEQFCINYCNEKLQQFFNERILKFEQELYKRESLSVPEISFTDNQDCIDVIEGKSQGILTLLDEESKLPKPSYAHFTEVVHKTWGKNYRLGLPRSSKLKAHRSIRDDEGFLIRHFAGAVCYQTKQFIDKNNDALHASLEGIIQESKNKLIQTLFSTSMAQKGKLTFVSVGSKFKTQLQELMEKLKNNGTNFIRCIKPNNKMVDHQFDGSLSLMQLTCSGMASVLELMEHGFPSRTPFSDLHNMYRMYLPKELRALSSKMFCESMLHSLKLQDKDFKFGITRVFFRPGKFAEFDKIMRSDPENLKSIVSNVKKWLVKSRWLKAQFCALIVIKMKNKIIYRRQALIIIQKHLRGYLVKKKYGPRIKTVKNIRLLNGKLKQLESVAQQLKKDREVSINGINQLKSELNASVEKIKKDDKMDAKATENIYTALVGKINQQLAALEKKVQEQKNREEQERLKKIQEEMERERRKKEEEERKLKEEEDNRKKKAEMEAKRKLEEETRLKAEEADRKLALELQKQQVQMEQEERKYQEQLEQERQDRELALRLAQESNGQIEESPPLIRNGYNGTDPQRASFKLNRSEAVRSQQASLTKGKHDLSKWKYSELRDTINTSCDIDLLEACRHEFHRRLKVYHAWKAKNKKRTVMNENERAPLSVLESAQKTPRLPQKAVLDNNTQRFFRIPFQRSGGDPNMRGWWYAHFDGQYVARQMELHPDKQPILLVAGKDDMQMCELSLEETGLTRKRGAEILENEFNKDWEKNGGKSYVRPADRK
ncbi:myosin heavy chain 95F isoform X2 [Euwallacea similis]|uniref:myosin heavy chain 95F isoform X2 n=1 Tax=Euwallacea similis TaxID=1736056 RepID=UPI00344B20A7